MSLLFAWLEGSLGHEPAGGTSIHRQVFHLAPRIIFKFPEPSSIEKHRENGMFANMIFSG
jgi:hypothetical protein